MTIVCGYLTTGGGSGMRKRWNAVFHQSQTDAFFDVYRVDADHDLAQRLSEMFVHGRRGYSVAPPLQGTIVPLLDELDPSARKEKRVDTILNRGGILRGYCIGEEEGSDACMQRCAIWFS